MGSESRGWGLELRVEPGMMSDILSQITVLGLPDVSPRTEAVAGARRAEVLKGEILGFRVDRFTFFLYCVVLLSLQTSDPKAYEPESGWTREIGKLLPNNRRQRRTCYALCHILYPVSAAHTSIFRMDSNSTSYSLDYCTLLGRMPDWEAYDLESKTRSPRAYRCAILYARTLHSRRSSPKSSFSLSFSI